MKKAFITLKGYEKRHEGWREKEVVSVEFIDIGKGVLHLVDKNGDDYYYPLGAVESCYVRNY